MRKLVEFKLEDGSSVLVEIQDLGAASGLEPASKGGVLGTAKVKFEEAIETIKPVASSLVKKITSLSDPPHSIEVEFGLSLSAEAGAFVASSSVESSFKVTC